MNDECKVYDNVSVPRGDASLEYYCVVLHQTSEITRCFIVCCSTGEFITFHEEKNDMILRRDGHKELCPEQLVEKATLCIRKALNNYTSLNHISNRIVSLALCIQSNIAIAWSRSSGRSLYVALTEDDSRCDDTCQKLIQKSWRKSTTFHHLCGLPISARWAGVKLKWLLDNISSVQEAQKSGDLMFGTLDSWLLWNLTGGVCYATDVTNASHTMLMNLYRFSWDSVICKFLDIDPAMLPEIKSCAELYGRIALGSPCGLEGLPITGVVGDLKASVLGHQGTHAGSVSLHIEAGTSVSKLSIVVGEEPVFYRSILKGVGYLTSTVCYQLGAKDNVVYAIEATIYNSQNVIPWLRNCARFISTADDMDAVANSVADSGGCYFIPTTGPAHSPMDRIDYRHVNIWGVSLVGTKPGHIVRAALESIAVEVSQVLTAIGAVMTVPYGVLNISGDQSLARSDAFCQVVADYSGLKVDRMAMSESVIVGGALLAVIGISIDPSGLRGPLKDSFSCLMVPGDRRTRTKRWSSLASEQEALDHRFWIGGDHPGVAGTEAQWLLGGQARDKKYLASATGPRWARKCLSVLMIGAPCALLGFGAALALVVGRSRLSSMVAGP